MKAHVSIIPQEAYQMGEIAQKVGKYFDQHNLVFMEKTVLMKPSFVLPVSDEELRLSTNTNNAVTSGVAKALSERGAQILIGEHKTIGPARFAFSQQNIKEALKGIDNVDFVYLDEVKFEEIRPSNSYIENYHVKYPKLLLNGTVDFFISLPKLKTNIFAEITLSVKNSFGLIPKKDRLRYHNDNLHKHLAQVFLIREPDLVITDAIVAGEGQGPQQTTPVRSNMLIIGENGLDVDTVCCSLMQKDPHSIEHLEILSKRTNHDLNVESINIKNKDYLESKKKEFKESESTLALSDKLKVFQGQKVCKSGCLGMLRSALDTYGMNDGWDSLPELTILIGKDIDIPQSKLDALQKEKTVIFGNCAKKYKKYGTFIEGCPPDYFKTSIMLSSKKLLGENPIQDKFSTTLFLKSWFLYLIHKILPKKY